LSIDLGGGSILTTLQSVTVTKVPNVDFTFLSVCAIDNVDFTDLSINLESGATYSWDFDGDGSEDSSIAGDASYQYSTPGTYIAILTVDNGQGCTVSHEQIVEVLEDPIPDFIIVGGCVGEEIFILDNSTAVSSTASYSWDFDGDGIEDSQSSGDVSFVFDNSGDYTFNLSIDNGNGCVISNSQDITLHEIPTPDFEVLSDCFGLPSRFVDLSSDVSSEAIYSWDFDGDGISDDNTKGDTEFTFTEFKPYIATLTIDNGLGCTNVAEVIVDFRDAAAPDFLVGPSCINVETVFTDQSSELETAAIYSWDFNGDGLEDSNVPGSTFYTYTQPGIYQASLTIFNAELCSSTRTVQVEVTPPPAIDLGTDVELCTEGTVTIDVGTGYTSYFWSDGSSDQTLTVDSFGEYWVSITDVKGCRNIDTVQVKLKDLPEATFEYTVTYSPIDGIIVDFMNNSVEADTWAWDFGDGQTSDEQSPSNTYIDFSFFEDTPYTVCLTATDRCDQVSEYCEDLLLSPLFIEDMNDKQMNVFPNPGSGDFIIQVGDLDAQNLLVVNPKGIIVKREDIPTGASSIQVDLHDYASGIYLFIVSTSEKQVFRKVILEEK
jgi:PKD repeat protein